MMHYYGWDAAVPHWFVKSCIASLTKYAAIMARDNPSDPSIKDARVTVKQLAGYYGLCRKGKDSDNRIELEYARPFDRTIEQASAGNYGEDLTQSEITHGLRGLQQYIYQMYCEGEDESYMPDILRCKSLIDGLFEMKDYD